MEDRKVYKWSFSEANREMQNWVDWPLLLYLFYGRVSLKPSMAFTNCHLLDRISPLVTMFTKTKGSICFNEEIISQKHKTVKDCSLVQCSATQNGKKFFLRLRWNFLSFILWPLLLILSLGNTEKETHTILLAPVILIFICINEMPSQSSPD